MKGTEIELDRCVLVGTLDAGVHAFLGVPYAEAPVGSLRFAPPRAAHLEGRIDASTKREMLPQGPSDLDRPMGPLELPQNEGALTVCVWTPDTKAKAKLPVAVWLHGGANFCGAGAAPWYDGAALARTQGIVVVGVNYRLGALGFLQSPGLNDRNLAIEDQLEALRWVRRSIAAFGGDPEAVTVFGQSAGANAIVHMLGLPEAEGLFRRAWLLSPSIGRGNFTAEEAREVSHTLLTELGVDPKDEARVLERVREKTAADILAATDGAFAKLAPKFGGMLFRPVKDAWATPESSIAAAAAGAAKKVVEVVVGTTLEETLAFSADRSPAALEKLHAVQRDRFDLPAWEFAAALSSAGVPVRKYRFTWRAPDSVYGSCHCVDLPFLFSTFRSWRAPMLAGLTEHDGAALTRMLGRDFGAFVRGEALPDHWPQWRADAPVHRVYAAAGAALEALPREAFN